MSGNSSPGRRGCVAVATTAVVVAAGATLSGGASGAGPEQSVTSVLSAANAPLAQLHETRAIAYRNLTITRYQQTVAGVPVINGEVAVMAAPGMAPTVVGDGTSQVAPALKSVTRSARRISADRALAIARSATGASRLRARPTAALAVDPAHGALVRRVELASGRPLKDFEVRVDASSGHVVSIRNRLQDATASAKVYTPNPVVVNGGYQGIGTTRQADHHDKDTAKLTALRRHVTFPVKNGQHCLVGPYVEARVGKYNGKPVCKTNLNWNHVTRHQNKFEALEAYSQISQVAGYYHDVLGFKAGAGIEHTNVHPKRQTIIADNFPDDNSFYSPGDHRIRYGTGGVDDAEDGDVVVHEYGHAIQDSQDPGFGIADHESGALGEGFGDYQSALNTLLSPGITPSFHDLYCIFDWDGTGGYGGFGVKPCGRLATGADHTRTYQQARKNCSEGQGREEVHCLGEVWARGLIDLLRNLPFQGAVRPIASDVLASQFGYTNDETFQQAVNGLVAADNALFAGANVTAICTEMKAHRGIHASACP